MVKKGVVIHPDELSEKWIQRALDTGINVIGIQPVGGLKGSGPVKELLERMKTSEFRRLIDLAETKGIKIEYEMHAISYLLDRDLFETHPEYFSEDANGVRHNKTNFCVSNEEAMEIVVKNAVWLAKNLYGKQNTFYFWMDDTLEDARCMCPNCRHMSMADQQMRVINRITTAIRQEISNAKVAYLGYFGFLEVPKLEKPVDGVFLEYAPMYRYVVQDKEKIRWEEDQLKPLMDFFGHEDTKVLEYWLDNSFLSGNQKPPKPFCADAESVRKDVQKYLSLGVKNISNFACYLGQDYEELYGEPDITPYTNAFA